MSVFEPSPLRADVLYGYGWSLFLMSASAMTYLIMLSRHVCRVGCIKLSVDLLRMKRLAHVALPLAV